MYLSKLLIENFRGIQNLEAKFNPSINFIIGENGSWKSALIDAIRLLYALGESRREIFVSDNDFFIDISSSDNSRAEIIKICYQFSGLSDGQKGALYEYMVIPDKNNPKEDYAQITLVYQRRPGKNPSFSHFSGNSEGQKPDPATFEYFQHYYLGALRDSTKDMLSARKSILGNLIQRAVTKNSTETNYTAIVNDANDEMLKQQEVIDTRDRINENLENIFKNFVENKIGLKIEGREIEQIVNLIQPYLPFDLQQVSRDGLELSQNSLGFNNLIYIATVLGDINQRVANDDTTHFALLIEEPEAHLHPQLQLSLFNFLRATTKEKTNCQLLVTTHSPTLTSKVPLENLILLEKKCFQIHSCFIERDVDNIKQDALGNKTLSDGDFLLKRKQLERYLDVTRAQLFFAKSIVMVEGISEELLVPIFCRLLNFELADYRIELLNVDGTSFYPFMSLFNSSNENKRIPKKVSIISDDDRFPESKSADYSFEKITENNFQRLSELFQGVVSGTQSSRAANLISFANNQGDICIKLATKTFEYELVLSNIAAKKSEIDSNILIQFVQQNEPAKYTIIRSYLKNMPEELSQTDHINIALLVWKSLPSKATFAQDFGSFLSQKIESQNGIAFSIPNYIVEALNHLKN